MTIEVEYRVTTRDDSIRRIISAAEDKRFSLGARYGSSVFVGLVGFNPGDRDHQRMCHEALFCLRWEGFVRHTSPVEFEQPSLDSLINRTLIVREIEKLAVERLYDGVQIDKYTEALEHRARSVEANAAAVKPFRFTTSIRQFVCAESEAHEGLLMWSGLQAGLSQIFWLLVARRLYHVAHPMVPAQVVEEAAALRSYFASLSGAKSVRAARRSVTEFYDVRIRLLSEARSMAA